MLAAERGHVEVGKLLVREFSRCVRYRNRLGLDALAIASHHPASTGLIPVLLNEEKFPASPDERDFDGNSPLHHASASGSLKALRILLAAGANPLAKNNYDWTPLAYSQTVAAEVYLKNLIAEFERRRVEGQRAEEERERQRAAGVRVVDVGEEVGGTPRKLGGSGGETRADEDAMIEDALKRHWSPRERKRPMTPGSGGKHEWDSRLVHMRTRSGSGD